MHVAEGWGSRAGDFAPANTVGASGGKALPRYDLFDPISRRNQRGRRRDGIASVRRAQLHLAPLALRREDENGHSTSSASGRSLSILIYTRRRGRRLAVTTPSSSDRSASSTAS
ncbi:hypothetical protein MVEN_00014900 [Mycena venus]|uniref:Uncharacterized protein n=1 Tax=Mycena venus TaxID=2733690 RepID=A0A8H6Z2V1_9AGAR|nr:hypothetical protein MVEN_00014900 [Mycena venus]